tara:strand:+ start:986 stop:3274 length:2289 start_codon:yes stop_codon:yes gene_type:complete
MREVQIYIEDQRIDLFKDESIEVTSSIQDAKDISKVFTDYSQSFALPASAENNKIFKHFYNFNISGGFDGRVRHEAKIYINSLLFKKGKIFLNGVNMKNNVPHTYNVTFFGNTVSLTDLFGDDKLIALDLESFNHEYSYGDVGAFLVGDGLEVDGDASALIYPLITSKKRLFYDSTLANDNNANFEGNLYVDSSFPGGLDRYEKRGVTNHDLKPAIKVYHIIKAIESKYGITLIPNDSEGTKDFFSKHNEAISNLYLWLSNSAGNIFGDEGSDEYAYKTIISQYAEHPDDNADIPWFTVSGSELRIGQETGSYVGQQHYNIRIKGSASNIHQGDKYSIKLIDKSTGQVVFSIDGVNDIEGDYSFTPRTEGDPDLVYEVEVSSKNAMAGTKVSVEVLDPAFGGLLRDVYMAFDDNSGPNSDNISTSTVTLSVREHLPDMKILDFLTGMFKMFNLTAYYIDDESDPEYNATTPVIKVITLDEYYADAVNNQSNGIIDVSKYIDVSSHVVNTSLPFSEIEFKFKEADTLLMENHTNLFGKTFGDSALEVQKLYPTLFLGKKYEVKLPFGKLKYERIIDTNIQWGFAAGGDFSPQDPDYSDLNDIRPPKGGYTSTKMPPLLFYGLKVDASANPFNYSNPNLNAAGVYTGYWRASNRNEDSTAAVPAEYSINFGSEPDEWTAVDDGYTDNSLFAKYYRNYIKSVFDPSKRIFKFEAYLPPSFLIHYKLNDQLKIQDVVYRINSITTNLTTGKSTLELINLNAEEIVE